MKLKDIQKAILVWGVVSQEGLTHLRQEKKVIVVPEQRPYLLGLRHTVPLFKRENIKFFYCTDNVLGLLFYKNKVEKTYLFYKEKKNGGAIGPCGSLYAALLSKLHNVPVTSMLEGALDVSGFDRNASTLGGKDFLAHLKAKMCIIEPKPEFVPDEVTG